MYRTPRYANKAAALQIDADRGAVCGGGSGKRRVSLSPQVQLRVIVDPSEKRRRLGD